MEALKYFYYELGNKIWSNYGFVDGFSIHHNWYAKSHLAIDQGPIIVMIENYRTGLLWKLFMKIPDVQRRIKEIRFSISLDKKITGIKKCPLFIIHINCIGQWALRTKNTESNFRDRRWYTCGSYYEIADA
jgi:hypothetical protein